MTQGDQELKAILVQRLLWLIAFIIVGVYVYCYGDFQSKPAQQLPAFFDLPDQIQAAKEAYAEAYDIPDDASLTVKQLDEVLVPFYASHPRNDEGNFVSDDPRQFLEVPRQVGKRPFTIIRPYFRK